MDSSAGPIVRSIKVVRMTAIPLADLELAEGVDFEAKKAAGLDGRGECPKSFFESYSAMANTEGGTILLGAEEREERFVSLELQMFRA